MNVKRILVIADRKDSSQKALAHAALMAEQFKATLHVVGFSYERLSVLDESMTKEDIEAAKQKIIHANQTWLDEAVVMSKLPKSTTDEMVWSKDIAAWVTKHCVDHQYDLIIKTGHRSEHAFYVPTDWHLLRNGNAPVLLVADKKWRKKQAIMVSLDMASKKKTKQALNQKVIDAGKMLAAANDMPLHVCFSLAISPVLKDLGIVDKNKSVKAAKNKYIPKIQAMFGNDDIPLENIHIKSGYADKIVPSVASDIGAALVIMGSVGRKGLKAKVLGNTAESVLALLKTDVMIIQP
ncbi:universal stress protein [Paraglaciecola sp. 20A4]|uniref:universal stress protein n=1 Tax=Paraglaciecola sp. 20A4 TaxID=2687288 RepID=UPI001408D53F